MPRFKKVDHFHIAVTYEGTPLGEPQVTELADNMQRAIERQMEEAGLSPDDADIEIIEVSVEVMI